MMGEAVSPEIKVGMKVWVCGPNGLRNDPLEVIEVCPSTFKTNDGGRFWLQPVGERHLHTTYEFAWVILPTAKEV